MKSMKNRAGEEFTSAHRLYSTFLQTCSNVKQKMRGQSCLWHYNKPCLPPIHSLPLLLPYHRLSEDGEQTGERCFSNPTQLLLTSAAMFTGDGRGEPSRKLLDQTQALPLCALTSYLFWWTKSTGVLWVVNKGFELDASAGIAASDVQPAIHGWDPCALSHRHWCCISVRHSSSNLEGCHSDELEARIFFFFFLKRLFFSSPCQECS